MTGRCGNLRIALGTPIVDHPQVAKHLTPESMSQSKIQGQHEFSAFTLEVLRQLPGHLIKPARRIKDTWTPPLSQCLQDLIMMLQLVRHADYTLIGGCQ